MFNVHVRNEKKRIKEKESKSKRVTKSDDKWLNQNWNKAKCDQKIQRYVQVIQFPFMRINWR